MKTENKLIATLEVIRFAAEDVIATSSVEPTPTPESIELPADMFEQ